MVKITDMLGQEVQIGDRIAKAHKAKYSVPELLIGTVMEITQHRLNMRKGCAKDRENPLEDVLIVRWEASSDKVAELDRWEEHMAERRAAGEGPPPVGWDHPFPNYRVKTTALYVKHKAFLKIG